MRRKKHEATSRVQIYETLRSEIITGRRKAGRRLSIDDLKIDFGTSVTPVRDALQMLSQEGLVTIKPRSGYFVTRTTLKELRDMLDLREILESAAVERAAAKISNEEIAALAQVHAAYTGDDDASYTRYTDENRRFHGLLAEASGNRELAAMIKHLHDRLARFMVIRRAGRTQPEIHAQLIDKLAAHDVQGAVRAIGEELQNARRAVLERVMDEEAAHWTLGGPPTSTPRRT